jgi:hypothetical protein
VCIRGQACALLPKSELEQLFSITPVAGFIPGIHPEIQDGAYMFTYTTLDKEFIK